MNNAKVSILVPVYGVESYIERCAVSLLEQTYDNIEYVFVNDCTRDNSISVLEGVIERYPNRKNNCKVINHIINRGLGAARNTAVENASGDFVMHVDSDDFIDFNAVELAVSCQMATDSDIVSFGALMEYSNKTDEYVPKDYEETKSFCIDVLSRSQPHFIWGRLIRKSLYVDYKIRVVEGANMGEDLQILPKLIYYSKKCSVLRQTLYHYNLSNNASYAHTYSEKIIRQGESSFNEVYAFFQDKDPDYRDALLASKIIIYTRWLINILKGDLGSELFFSIRGRLKDIPFQYYRNLSLPYYVVTKVNSYGLLKLYINIIQKIKR